MIKRVWLIAAVVALMLLPAAFSAKAQCDCPMYDGDWCEIGGGQPFPYDCYSQSNGGAILHGVYHVDYTANINGVALRIRKPSN